MKTISIMKSVSPFSLDVLREHADRIRKSVVGDNVFLRGLIEFSNYCRCNCLYCGLRRDNAAINRYRLDDDDIIKAALEAAKAGVDTIVLQSGEDPAYTRKRIARIVARIKDETGLAVTLSVGNRSQTAYRLWKRSGADRYLLKHETANTMLYAAHHPGDSLERRLTALYRLRDSGYGVGTGFIVGLPGQSDEVLMQDIALTRSLGVEMCGVGPFIPQRNTPLAHRKPGSVEKTLKVIAYLRTHLPHLNIPATTALASLAPKDGHELALQAGANVIMPNFTPYEYKKNYNIYDGKVSVEMDSALTAIARCMRTVRQQPGGRT